MTLFSPALSAVQVNYHTRFNLCMTLFSPALSAVQVNYHTRFNLCMTLFSPALSAVQVNYDTKFKLNITKYHTEVIISQSEAFLSSSSSSDVSCFRRRFRRAAISFLRRGRGSRASVSSRSFEIYKMAFILKEYIKMEALDERNTVKLQWLEH